MNPEQEICYLNGVQLQARIILEGMLAENKRREKMGDSLAYVEEDFRKLIEEYEIHHNSLIRGLMGR